MNRREMLGRMGLTAAALTLPSCTAGRVGAGHTRPPNIILMVADDLRWDALGFMGHPFLQTPNIDRLRAEGAHFASAFVTTALCSPSRASILTGAYAHNHGVIVNDRREVDGAVTPTFPMLLREAGYETAFIGKWHMRHSAAPRPGFDYWLSFSGQGIYTDPVLNENGTDIPSRGYVTDLLTDYALKYIGARRDRPYCLCLFHKAVHSPFTPSARDVESYKGLQLQEPASARDTYAGKPRWTRAGGAGAGVPDERQPPKWDPEDPRRVRYHRTINGLDHSVGRIRDALEQAGELDNTVLIFTSDNGYFMGEHGLGDKRLMYEESIRVPLVVRYPALVKPGSTVDRMALNIDLAPTLLDLAGARPAGTMDGCSLLPLFSGCVAGWRTAFLYEYWKDLTPWIPRMVGVRTGDLKFVRYPDIDDIDELYDLGRDPLELRNVALAPEYADARRRLQAELARLLRETGWPHGAEPDAALPKRG